MCIGIKQGREEPTQSDIEGHVLSQQFLRRFRDEMGSIQCRELTGMDLSTPDGLQAYRSSDVRPRVCLPAAGLAYRLVLELLEERHPEA